MFAIQGLTPSQERAYKIMASGDNVFLTSSAGFGKSYVLDKYFKHAVRVHGPDKVYKTATTGISALNIGGSTIHSWAGIKLGNGTVNEIYANMSSTIKSRWLRTKVLFIDEISMLHPDIFDKLCQLCRLIKCSNNKFGQIQLIVSGDFFQLPCISNPQSFQGHCHCFEAEYWSKVIDMTVTLTDSVRQTDKNFVRILNQIRYGYVTNEAHELLKGRIGADLTNESGIMPTKLFATNREVDMINSRSLNKLISEKSPTDIVVDYHASYAVEFNNTNYTNQQLIDKCKQFSVIIPESMTLLKGAQVMCKKNIDDELVNGSRAVITGFDDDMRPTIRLLNGSVRTIEKQSFIYEIKKEYKVIKYQIPLKLASASTIHSIQGCTLDLLEADIGKNIFEDGQTYVVLSRCRSLEGLSLINLDVSRIRANQKVLDKYAPFVKDIEFYRNIIEEFTCTDIANIVIEYII